MLNNESMPTSGFVIIKNKVVLVSHKRGSYYCVLEKERDNFDDLLLSFINIKGVKVECNPIDETTSVLVLGNITHDRKNWIQLDTLLEGMGISRSNETVSSFVLFHHSPTTKEVNQIKKEAIKISQIVKNVEKTSSPIIQKPIIDSSIIKKNPQLLVKLAVIAVLIFSGPSFLEQFAAFASMESAKNGDFDNAVKLNDISKRMLVILNPEDKSAQIREIILTDLRDGVLQKDLINFNVTELVSIGDLLTEERLYRDSLSYYYFGYLQDDKNTRALNGIATTVLLTEDLSKICAYGLQPLFANDYDPCLRNLETHHEKVLDIYKFEKDFSNGVPQAYAGLGEIQLRLGNFTEANSYYQLIFDKLKIENHNLKKQYLLKPTYLEQFKTTSEIIGYLGLGKTSILAGNYTNGQEYFDEAQILDPTNLKITNAKAEGYYAEKEFHTAVNIYTDVLNLDPKSIVSLIGRGNSYLALQEEYRLKNDTVESKYHKEKADIDFAEAKKLDKDLPQTLIDKGNLKYDQGEYLAAKAFFESSLNLENDTSAMIGIGNSLMKLNDFKGSLKIFDKVLGMDRDNEQANRAVNEINIQLDIKN